MRSQTPSPHFGHARLQTMMLSFGHCTWPEPPEHSLNAHDVAPLQKARHGEPPEQVRSQLVAPSQFTSQRDPPEQFTLHSVTWSQST